MHSSIRYGFAIAVTVLACAAAFSVDAPDLRINGASGLIEAVDAAWSGSNYNVRYTLVSGAGLQSTSYLLSTNAADDLDPRIAIAENGDVLVAWWRDAAMDTVVYRKRAFASEAWSPEHAAGVAGESNSHPRVTHAGGRAWVAYQIQNSRSRSIGVQIIDDDPEPIRAIVATTSYAGDLDVRLHAEAGRVWVTWIDAGSNVGFAEYLESKRLWSVPAYESFAADSVALARARIRGRVLAH